MVFAPNRVHPFAVEEASSTHSRTSGSSWYRMLWFSTPVQHELLHDMFPSIWLCTVLLSIHALCSRLERGVTGLLRPAGLAWSYLGSTGPPWGIPLSPGWVGCESLGWDQPRAPHSSLFAGRQMMPKGSRLGEKQQLPGKAPKGFTACLA